MKTDISSNSINKQDNLNLVFNDVKTNIVDNTKINNLEPILLSI